MNELSERLRFLMDREGLSQKGLSELTGASAQSVHNWLKRNSISKDSAKLVSERTGYSLDWLLNNVGMPKLSGPQGDAVITNAGTDALHDFYRVDVLDVQASAGSGAIVSTEFIEKIRAIEYTTEQARVMFGNRPPEIVKVITVRGDSMEGTINPGDEIFVDTSVTHFDGDGIYVFVFGKTLHVKRLQMQRNRLSVISDNTIYKEWFIEDGDEDQFHIMAKVLMRQSIEYRRFG